MTAKTAAAYFFDFIFLVCVWIFLTGFIPFTPEKIYILFDQKPWLHRAASAGASALGLLTAFFYHDRSILFAQIKKIRLPARTGLWMLFAAAGSLWTYASWMRHGSFKSGFDMAIFTQAVWNTTQGTFLYSSIKGGICLLGDHFSPLLAVFALPYVLWPKPECLLLLQSFGAASAIFPLYRLASKKTGDSAWAFCVILAFCFYLPLRNSVRFEFHPEIFTIPLLIWAYIFLIENKSMRASMFLFLALSAKETLAPVTFMFGFYALFSIHKRFAVFWMIFSALYLFLVTRIWIPAISGQEYFYLSGNFMAWKEEGALALAKHLLNPGSLAYLIKIYLPVGFLSFLDFSFLLNLPALVQNISSRNEATRSIFFQYTATLTPFVFISTVETLKRFYPRRWFLLFFIFSSILMAGVSDFYIARHFQAEKTQDLKTSEAVFAAIPPSVSVRTHEFFAAHLANRKELHIYENNHPQEGGSEKARSTDFVILHRRLLGTDAQTVLKTLGVKYRLESENDGLFIFKKI